MFRMYLPLENAIMAWSMGEESHKMNVMEVLRVMGMEKEHIDSRHNKTRWDPYTSSKLPPVQ